MLKLNLRLYFLFFSFITITLFLKCTGFSDYESLVSEENSVLALKQKISDLKKSFFETQQDSDGDYVAVSFDIKVIDSEYAFENIQYLNQFDYGFAQGMNGFLSSSLIAAEDDFSGGIKVSCEETGEITECPEESGWNAQIKQARCVAQAISDCLDSGGCADVCSMSVIIVKIISPPTQS